MLEILLVFGLSRALGCNHRYVNDIVETHLNPQPAPNCKLIGEQCKFDRNCCEGLECELQSTDDFNMEFVCGLRKFASEYIEFEGKPSWKDYQELQWSEEGYTNNMDAEQLEKENALLRRKITELRKLRKVVRNQHNVNLRRKLEEAEIEALEEQRRDHEQRYNQDVERLKQKELHDQLLNLERKEVNDTLFKQQRVAELYMDMLAELSDKGTVNKPNL